MTGLALLGHGVVAGATADPLGLGAEIRETVRAPGGAGLNRPLPLMASWNTGVTAPGYDPDYQLGLLERGHHLLPWLQLDYPPDGPVQGPPAPPSERALKGFARLGLPLVLVATQWERLLGEDPAYRRGSVAANPLARLAGGQVLERLSPFGPIDAWEAAGRRWGGARQLRAMAEIYPNPPLVVFLSNNEQPKLAWRDAARELRLGSPRPESDDALRRVVGQGWIDRYGALLRGFGQALPRGWRGAARFVGFDAFGGPAFGRWPGWIETSLVTGTRMEPWPEVFDGASIPFYLNDWDASSDDRVFSPQVEAMNQVFMLEDAFRAHSGFWLELSVWDGGRRGKDFGTARYAAMARFGLWLLRPRVLREYRGYTETRPDTERHFLALLETVDEVYRNPVLRSFWREGALVANRAHEHPYQVDIPPAFRARDRWFLLDTSAEAPRPWRLDTAIPVFAIALVRGHEPQREWLVYAHAPHGDGGPVRVRLPDYGEVAVSAKISGGFWRVREHERAVEALAVADSEPGS